MHAGVYAVGRPELSDEGRWFAAVLAGGPSAVLSYVGATALWGLCVERPSAPCHVSVPSQSGRSRRRSLVLHRCATLSADDFTHRRRVPVTTLARTLLDIARPW